MLFLCLVESMSNCFTEEDGTTVKLNKNKAFRVRQARKLNVVKNSVMFLESKGGMRSSFKIIMQ